MSRTREEIDADYCSTYSVDTGPLPADDADMRAWADLNQRQASRADRQASLFEEYARLAGGPSIVIDALLEAARARRADAQQAIARAAFFLERKASQ